MNGHRVPLAIAVAAAVARIATATVEAAAVRRAMTGDPAAWSNGGSALLLVEAALDVASLLLFALGVLVIVGSSQLRG